MQSSFEGANLVTNESVNNFRIKLGKRTKFLWVRCALQLKNEKSSKIIFLLFESGINVTVTDVGKNVN